MARSHTYYEAMEKDNQWLLDQVPEGYTPGDGARVPNRSRETMKERLKKEAAQEVAVNQYLVKQAVGRLALANPNPESNWRNRALCSFTAPDIFDTTIVKDVELAKVFCQSCDVREVCEQYAIEMNDPGAMVWGGLSPDELRVVRRRARNKRRQEEIRRKNS